MAVELQMFVYQACHVCAQLEHVFSVTCPCLDENYGMPLSVANVANLNFVLEICIEGIKEIIIIVHTSHVIIRMSDVAHDKQRDDCC